MKKIHYLATSILLINIAACGGGDVDTEAIQQAIADSNATRADAQATIDRINAEAAASQARVDEIAASIN